MHHHYLLHRIAVLTTLLLLIGSVLLSSCATSSTDPGDNPPGAPSNPDPADGSTDQPVDVALCWSAPDPDGGTLRYSIFFGIEQSNMPLVSSNQTSNNYDPGTLLMGTQYFWQVKVKDPEDHVTLGSIWTFTTVFAQDPLPPYPPFDPSPADGATDVEMNVLFEWSCSDPNGDDLIYDVYFGESADPPMVTNSQTANTYQVAGLDPLTTYYWKIVASDLASSTSSPVWSFTTKQLSENQLWSPDGQKLLFGGEGINMGLWVYYRSSGILEQITDETYPHNYDYCWSPNSDQVAFSGAGAIIDSASGVYVVALDGSDPERLHPTGQSPTWAPNGSNLVFVEDDPANDSFDLYKYTFAGSAVTYLLDDGIDPQYNPAGDRIAYRDPGSASEFPLKVADAFGTVLYSLAGSCHNFVWYPDGNYLIYDAMQETGMHLFSVPSSGGASAKITDHGTQPSVSSGGLIAYQRLNVDVSLGIYTIAIDGSGNQMRTSTGFQPAITPDGSLIAYARGDGIWLVNL